MKEVRYQRLHCTELCPRQQVPELACMLCQALDERDRFWRQLRGGGVIDAVRVPFATPESSINQPAKQEKPKGTYLAN